MKRPITGIGYNPPDPAQYSPCLVTFQIKEIPVADNPHFWNPSMRFRGKRKWERHLAMLAKCKQLGIETMSVPTWTITPE